ncbi:conserved hypothetical protein [Aspergillus fumigatus A1163]|uniref:Uncharacterized protein n=1 Tax=Aspergillus fumigatus (strain CBS 144.89 / FGSC A1163 / CEA10) TaxID=451804 RepID=B0XW35_ASPFC|nr:conserved hypothetical protein [Aspergillus fumigatus A1163]
MTLTAIAGSASAWRYAEQRPSAWPRTGILVFSLTNRTRSLEPRVVWNSLSIMQKVPFRMAAFPDFMDSAAILAITSGRASNIISKTPIGQLTLSRMRPSSSSVLRHIVIFPRSRQVEPLEDTVAEAAIISRLACYRNILCVGIKDDFSISQ